jgi:CHRD domain
MNFHRRRNTVIGAKCRQAVVMLVGLSLLAWAGLAVAAPISFKVPLSGADQVPPVKTTGTGTAHLTWNSSTRILTWRVTYSDMSSPVTMAHFHHGARGHNGPVVIWLTKKAKPVTGPIVGEVTLSPKEAEEFEAGDWYINVHTKDHPAGEIRGQVVPPKA